MVVWLDGLAGEFGDEGRHGHFDVEFDHVCDGVELDVDEWVFEKHETDEHDLMKWGGDVSIKGTFVWILRNGTASFRVLKIKVDEIRTSMPTETIMR